MQQKWRFVPPIEASGFTQMAIDEWFLSQYCSGRSSPCLRFYTWDPIAISLGYHQRHYPKSWSNFEWHGCDVDLVRRPSGGRAVLHQGDLTYSLVVSQMKGRRRDVYQHLCQFLILGWRNLGIEVFLGADNRHYQQSANCFGSTTAADLVMKDGYKLIGSAQLYRDGCILQHGSMRLSPDPDLYKAVFGTSIQSPSVLRKIGCSDLITALMAGAREVFGVEFELRPLLPQELEQALCWAAAQHKA